MLDSISQKTGHTVGYGLLGGAAAATGAAFFAVSALPFIGVAVVAGSLGYWFLHKLYLNDPAARQKYIAQIRSASFSESLKYFGKSTVIVDLIDITETRALFEAQFPLQQTALSALIKALGLDGVLDVKCTSVITTEVLKKLFALDVKVSRSGNMFSELWGRFEENLDQVQRLQVFDAEALRALCTEEYKEYQPPRVAAPTAATAPPPDDSRPPTRSFTPGGRYGVYGALNRYGIFCVEQLNMDLDFFRNAVRKCSLSKEEHYSKLLAEGLYNLFTKGLVEGEWCEQKLQTELRETNVTLWDLDAHVSIKQQIHSKMIRNPSVLRRVFSAAVPSTPFSGFSSSAMENKKTSIVDFLDYFKDILPTYGDQLLDSSLWPHVLRVKEQWDAANRQLDDKFPWPLSPKTTKSDGSPREDAKIINEEYQKKRAAAQSKRDAFLADTKKSIHFEFTCKKAGQAYLSSDQSYNSCSLM